MGENSSMSVFRRHFLAAAAILLAAMSVTAFVGVAPAQAQVTGRYVVDGLNPDGTTYEGGATVEKTGDTYRVTWVVGSTRFIGTGIGSDEALAITYRAGNNTGVALLFKEGGSYQVVWTYAGGTAIGAERWRRR
jgi:hypothetical protein